ncbi:MAG TPA: glycosyltransferase family 39 protein [Solirubrobacteraceae bacterium]|nr:glycosyltransferase family 39 protein [Solirubrobacteraceae bacterium]
MRPATVAVWLVVAMLAGIALRLAVNRGMSVDEIMNVDQARLGFGALISQLTHGTHPPLHPVLEWCAVHLFGDGRYAVRIPSLVAGILLIPVAAWLAGDLFDRRTAVVAGLFTSVAPILIWYSQSADPYAFVALFGTLAIIGALRARRRGRPLDWVLHVLGASLAVWSSWSGVFIVVATEILLLLAALQPPPEGRRQMPYLAAWALDSLALACQFVPLGLLFASQMHSNGGVAGVMSVGAAGVTFYTTVSNLSWAIFGFHPGTVTSALSAVWPLAMLASLVVVGRGAGRRAWLLLICVLVPALGTLALGLAAPNAFDVRYAIAGVPPLMVALARMATGWPRGRLGRGLVVAGVLIVLLGALADQQLDPNNPRRFDYRAALTQVRRDQGRSSAVFYEPRNLNYAVGRYTPGLPAKPLSRTLPPRAQAGSVFLITSFTDRSQVHKLLDRELGALKATRRLVHFRSYPGVDVWWYR